MGLQGQNQDCPKILKYENAEGNASRRRIQFKLVVKEFNDDSRTAWGAEYGQIEGVNAAFAQIVSQQLEEAYANEYAEQELTNPGIDQLSTRRKELCWI